MKKTIISILLMLACAGCAITTVTPDKMREIERKNIERDPGLSRYAYPWQYAGSDQDFDYVLHSGVIGDRDLYRVRKGKLRLEKRFERTRDTSVWIPINVDGSTITRH